MKKNLRSEKGITGIDIGISVIVITIFISLIAVLISSYNSRVRELELRTEATYIAVNEIESIKSKGFSEFQGMGKGTVVDKNGNNLVFQPVAGQDGLYKTITIEDYKDINKGEGIVSNVAKKITVEITYVYKSTNKNIKLSTVLTKES